MRARPDFAAIASELDGLDKSAWETFRFDQIAENISERIDPNNTNLEIYIGLEHLDSESLHIKRFGKRRDVSGQKLKFYKGDMIFGRRRAYLRKAGIAPCEGFCSAHALVLRAMPETIQPSLFPFFLHSDSFMHRAVDISVGSLSPTINWGTLKHQEFLLPPKEMQNRFSELLNSLDLLMKTEEIVAKKLDLLSRAKLKSILTGQDLSEPMEKRKNISRLPVSWSVVHISAMFDRLTAKNKDLESENVLTISAKAGLVNQETYFNKKVSSKDLSNYYLLKKGDFAYNKSYSDGYPAGAIKELERYVHGVVSPLYICMRPVCSDYLRVYYKHLFESGFLNQQILAVAKEGARAHGLLNVAASDFFNVKIPVPSREQVSDMMASIEALESACNSNQDKLSAIKKLHDGITNKVF